MAQLNDEDKDARNWAAYAVARIDPLVALKDQRTFVRVSALKALGGDSRSLVSPEGIEVVLRLVRDETEEVRVGPPTCSGRLS